MPFYNDKKNKQSLVSSLITILLFIAKQGTVKLMKIVEDLLPTFMYCLCVTSHMKWLIQTIYHPTWAP